MFVCLGPGRPSLVKLTHMKMKMKMIVVVHPMYQHNTQTLSTIGTTWAQAGLFIGIIVKYSRYVFVAHFY